MAIQAGGVGQVGSGLDVGEPGRVEVAGQVGADGQIVDGPLEDAVEGGGQLRATGADGEGREPLDGCDAPAGASHPDHLAEHRRDRPDVNQDLVAEGGVNLAGADGDGADVPDLVVRVAGPE